MKLLLDMNLSPLLVPALRVLGHDAVHWIDVGPPGATDIQIMSWARESLAIVLTQDLDFGELLGAGGAMGPSVIQLRVDRMAVAELAALVAAALRDHAPSLKTGALPTLDVGRRRLRMLPIDRARPVVGN